MKLELMASALAVGAQAALENCLYCRYLDLRASTLESWYYCPYNQECLADQWNYIDRECPEEGWSRAYEKSLDYCEIEDTQCPEFVSSLQYDLNEPLGKERNITWSLPPGSQCNVSIDATEYVGRVLFDDVQGYLGIEGYDPEFDIKNKISFDGEVGKVLIYNAQQTGALRFTISFSSATTTVASALVLLAATSFTMI